MPCDLIIEQVLMRSLKTTGGLTRGPGMSDVTRVIWVMSKPVCSKYGHVMEENIGALLVNSIKLLLNPEWPEIDLILI